MDAHSTILPPMASPARCPRCGRENDAGSAFCLGCGQPLAAGRAPATTEALCASCGAPLQSGSRFCGACGKSARSPLRPRTGDPAREPASGAGAGRAPPAPPPPAERIRLTLVRNDGVPGPVFTVAGEEALCGRTHGEIRLGDDPSVSPRHARFTLAGGVLRVEDLGSVNGTYLRLKEPRRLAAGDEFRVGRQLLRLEPLPRPRPGGERGVLPWGTKDPGHRFRLSQLLEGGGVGEIFPLREGENVLGRDAGEVTFPSDRYVSARHARITVSAGEVTLADTGSSNGTYVKLAGVAELGPGDQLLVGAQLLRVG
jgi:pSer/pThr/pTyr-binding forkhead associated (FHA) protein